MTQWKFFEGDVAPFTDDEFYRDREAAHHLEQGGHTERLLAAVDLIELAVKDDHEGFSISDLGCGDGGLLQVVKQRLPWAPAWGYDMQPSNVAYAQQVRNVDVRLTNFEAGSIEYGKLSVMTEVLEHVSDPHGAVRACESKYLVASSPLGETPEAHYEFHNWGFDREGYYDLLQENGFTVVAERVEFINLILLGVRE